MVRRMSNLALFENWMNSWNCTCNVVKGDRSSEERSPLAGRPTALVRRLQSVPSSDRALPRPTGQRCARPQTALPRRPDSRVLIDYWFLLISLSPCASSLFHILYYRLLTFILQSALLPIPSCLSVCGSTRMAQRVLPSIRRLGERGAGEPGESSARPRLPLRAVRRGLRASLFRARRRDRRGRRLDRACRDEDQSLTVTYSTHSTHEHGRQSSRSPAAVDSASNRSRGALDRLCAPTARAGRSTQDCRAGSDGMLRVIHLKPQHRYNTLHSFILQL